VPNADLALQLLGVDDRYSTDPHGEVVEVRAASALAAIM
jgi:hypothetical protein